MNPPKPLYYPYRSLKGTLKPQLLSPMILEAYALIGREDLALLAGSEVSQGAGLLAFRV